jgi:hypothetical protein
MQAACAYARLLARVHKQLARSHKMRSALSSRRFGRLHLKSRRTRQMEEDRKRLETFLLDADNCELIATLLAVIRMAEEMREMTAGLKKVIAAQRDCRSTSA